ncbi:MAG: 30S ribosomal protein S21 [Patescibacteria group bacterium]
MIELNRRKGESVTAFLHRFSTRIKQSGVLREAKKRRYYSRPINKAKRRAAALYRAAKKKEFEKKRKSGR